jgi:hypothetical protein
MAKIAIVNDASEVVVLLFQFLTHGHHEFFKMIGQSHFVVDSLVAFRPDVIVLPLYRRPEAIGRAVVDYRRDIMGATMLELLSARPELAEVPIILFGISTLPGEMPPAFLARVHYADFLTFPDGLQVLNPTISGYVGSASGTPEDFERLKRHLAEFHAQPPGQEPGPSA